MENGYKPVLQIVHVSDLHVKTINTNPMHPLNKDGMAIRRSALRAIRKHNLLGWDEGTQGHYPQAPDAFASFLSDLKAKDTLWSKVPTWLIDTGDRTAFGDAGSISEGEKYLQQWAKALGNCPYLSIYGNHDAWPGTLPALNHEAISDQRKHVHAQPGWDPVNWRANPLTIEIMDGTASIELFAADTICWGVKKNTCAVGELDSACLEALHSRFKTYPPRKSLRILATHHPLAFPWQPDETNKNGLDIMRLLNDEACIRRFSNEGPVINEFGPWFHLFLSGHTHRAHPSHGHTANVVDIHQASLGDYQLQLVGGPLMLNKRAENIGAYPPASKDFTPATVDTSSCQAQILRFYASLKDSSLIMLRLGVYSHEGGAKYAFGQDAIGKVRLHYVMP